MEKQIVVTCDNCKSLMAFSESMGENEANELKSRLAMNPFGAPRCKKCEGTEPYSDINLAHTIAVVDFMPDRQLA